MGKNKAGCGSPNKNKNKPLPLKKKLKLNIEPSDPNQMVDLDSPTKDGPRVTLTNTKVCVGVLVHGTVVTYTIVDQSQGYGQRFQVPASRAFQH